MGKSYLRNFQDLKLKRSAEPAATSITLEEAKEHLKYDGSDYDSYLTDLLQVADDMAQKFMNRSLITQTWQMFFRYWPNGSIIRLFNGPVQSVTSVQYTDTEGVLQTVDSSNYTVGLNSDVPEIIPIDSWDETNNDYSEGVVITYVTGYGDANTDVPAKLKQGIKVLLGDLDRMRHNPDSTFQTLPTGQLWWEYLLQPYKIYYYQP